MTNDIVTEFEILSRMQATAFALSTRQLHLDAFTPDDAPHIQRLAGDYDIYRMTARMPHPYHLHHAQTWIAGQPQAFERGRDAVWAMRHKASLELVGSISFELSLADSVATLGYWVGKPYWRNGYITEAARAVTLWAHEVGILRIASECLRDNVASEKTLRRLGLREEGCRRRHAIREDRRQDVLYFGADTEELVRTPGPHKA